MLSMYECVCIATHRIQFSKSKAGPFTEIRGCLAANCTSAPVQLQSGGSKGRASNPFVGLLCRKPCCVFWALKKIEFWLILRSLVLYHVNMHRCSSSSILGRPKQIHQYTAKRLVQNGPVQERLLHIKYVTRLGGTSSMDSAERKAPPSHSRCLRSPGSFCGQPTFVSGSSPTVFSRPADYHW